MKNYYLTEMTTLRLENVLMKFILDHQVPQKLVNGIIEKVASMMYQKHIDYYYIDEVATLMNVPIKQIDNIYLHGYHQYYQKPLQQLLETTTATTSIVEDAPQLEENVEQILHNRKPIKTKKYHHH